MSGFRSKTYRGVVFESLLYLTVHDKIDVVRKKSQVEVVLLVGSAAQEKPI
jgi:hypothetical protein